LDVPLDLVLEAEPLPGDATTSRGGRQLAAAAAAKAAAKPVLIRTSVKVTVTEPRVEVSAGELFAAPIEGVFANARSSFASCGGTAADRRFSVEVPGAGYAAAGDVARLENTASVAERIAYLEAHSLTPTDAFRPDQLVNLLTR